MHHDPNRPAPGARFFDTAFFNTISAGARESLRLRQPLNLHASHEEPVQRLFNAIEPGSYVRPHRHPSLPAKENLFVLRGRLGVLLFDEQGAVSTARALTAGGDTCGLEIDAGVWHGVISLEPGTVILEVKQGPYVMAGSSEFAPWSAEAGTDASRRWLTHMETLFSA